MSIKFQRIDQKGQTDRGKGEEDDSETESDWHFWPILGMIVVLLSIGGVVYYFMFSNRYVFPGIVQAPERTVAAPESGTVTYIVSEETERISAHQVLARVQPDHELGTLPMNNLNQLRNKREELRARLEQLNEKRGQPFRQLPVSLQVNRLNLRERFIDLNRELSVVEENRKSTRTKMRLKKREWKEVRRLYRLDAATIDAKRRAKSEYLEVQGKLKTIRAREEKLREKRKEVKQTLLAGTSQGTANRSFPGTEEGIGTLPGMISQLHDVHQKRNRTERDELERRISLLNEAVRKQQHIIEGRNQPVPLKASTGGAVLKRYFERGQHVQKGEPVVSVYQQQEKYVQAFVPSRHATDLKKGQRVRVYSSTADQYFSGEIRKIHERMEETPDRRRIRELASEQTLLPVDVLLSREAREKMVLNNTCRIISWVD